MIDALDALKLMRTQSMRQSATRFMAPKISQPLVNIFKSAPGPKADLFQKGLQPQAGALPKAIRGALKPAEIQPEAHKALLEKPASSGGSGGLFQTLKSKFLDKITPAPVQPAMTPVQHVQKALEAARLNVAEAAPKPVGVGQNNPFRTMESVLLNQHAPNLGLQNPGLTTQASSAVKREMNQKPANAAAAVAMPLTGIGLVTSPLAGPTALVMKPALVNPFVAKLPVLIP